MKITAFRNWSPDRMRKLCCKQGWFTCGTNKQYDEMMDYVRAHNASYEDMAIVASMIIENSNNAYFADYDDEGLVAHIMYWIEKEVVITLFNFEATYK